MDHQQFVDLLVELCPLLELEEVIDEEDATSCTIVCNDETLIIADHDIDQKRLILTAPVNVIADPGSENVLAGLLSLNAGTLCDKGAWLSLRQPEKLVVLTMEVAAGHMTLASLRTALENCMASIAEARALLETLQEAGAGAVPATGDALRPEASTGDENISTSAIKV